MKKNKFLLLFFITILTGCHNEENANDEMIAEVKTPVTVTGVENRAIKESIYLNASSLYQRKNTIKAITSGYVEKVFITAGDHIEPGIPLFTIMTKEAEALSKQNSGDSIYSFKGILTISSPSTGIITEIKKQAGDYLSEGDELAIIADQSSFVFILNVPFELNKFTTTGTECRILLPDSSLIMGTITAKLATIDPVSQTQSYVVKPKTNSILPENLSVTIQIDKSTKQNAQVIVKSAVLSDETMENLWVMKLINDSTAVKIQVRTGIRTENLVEIISPIFSKDDRIIESGNYGLADTAFVSVNKQ